MSRHRVVCLGTALHHVGLAEHHDVDVVRCRTGIPEHPRGEGAVEERGLDPVDASKLLGQHHHRAGRDREDLAQGDHQRALVVGADQPRAAHLSLRQDASVHQARHLTVHGRVGQASPVGQICDAQLIAGEQHRREQARLTVRPADRGERDSCGLRADWSGSYPLTCANVPLHTLKRNST